VGSPGDAIGSDGASCGMEVVVFFSPSGSFFGGVFGPGIGSPAFGIVGTPWGTTAPQEPHELQLSQQSCLRPNQPLIRLNRPLLSHDSQDEQLVQEPQAPWLQLDVEQLSQQSCLRKRSRKRSHHDAFSQQLSQDDEQDEQQLGWQAGLQQGAG